MHKLLQTAAPLAALMLPAFAVPALAQDAAAPAAGAPPTTTTAPGAGAGTAAGNPPTAEQIAAMQKQLDAVTAQADALKTLLDTMRNQAAKSTPVTVGYGKLKIGGLAQVWEGLSAHPDGPGASGTQAANAYFKTGGFGARLRRLELHLDGSIDPVVEYHFNADFTRGSSTQPGTVGILQDLFFSYKLGQIGVLDVGQEKLPLTEVGLHSSGQLYTIERPLIVIGPGRTAGTVNTPLWGDIRETGVQFKRADPLYSVQLALTQGAGDYQNSASNQYGKTFSGQVFVRPFGPNSVQFGVTGLGGAGFVSGGQHLSRSRMGGSIVWNPGKFAFESEYVAGTDGLLFAVPAVVGPPAIAARNVNVNAHRHGEYAVLGYDLGRGLQVVGQYDYFDPGQSSANVPGAAAAILARQTNYTLGLNQDLDGALGKGHRRLQINYVHAHFDGLGASTPQDNDQLEVAEEVNF